MLKNVKKILFKERIFIKLNFLYREVSQFRMDRLENKNQNDFSNLPIFYQYLISI